MAQVTSRRARSCSRRATIRPRDRCPQRLRPPASPLRVQPAGRTRAHQRACRTGVAARVRRDGDHGPRGAVRRGGLRPGDGHQGDQADRRRGDVRRSPEHARQGGQGRQPALPPRSAGGELGGLPEPLPPRHGRAPRRLLLQAPDRPRAPGQALEGSDRPVGLPGRGDPEGPRSRRLGARPAALPASIATSSARTTSSWSSRTTALPLSTASTSSSSAWARRSASSTSSPTTSTTSAASRRRHTTSCCASARAATSTRRAACASSPTSST